MLMILIAFVIGCLALDFYAVCELKKCDKNVRYVQKLPHRVIGKVQLVRKIHEIGAFLGFGFFVTFGIVLMWFWALEAQIQSNIWQRIITAGLFGDGVFFGLLFIWCINMYQRICEL